MNFDLVKLRLASPKAYSAPTAGSYERSKNVMQTLSLWYLIKIISIKTTQTLPRATKACRSKG